MKFTPEQIQRLIADATPARARALEPIVPHLRAQVGDAFNTEAFARAIARIETQSFLAPQLSVARKYARLLPVTNPSAALGTALVLKQVTAYGMGKPYAGTGNDIPLVGTKYKELNLKVKAGAVGYQYSVMELAAAARANVALQADSVLAANLAFERHMHKVAFLGEPETGLFGLFNNPQAENQTATAAWATATPDQIMGDLAAAFGIAQDDADLNGDPTVIPNTILIPSELFRILNTRRLSDHSDMSILKYLRENNPLSTSGQDNVIIEAMPELNTADAGNPRVILYRRDPLAMEMIIPQELQFLTPQPTGLDLYIPGHYLYAGVWLKRLKSLIYLDGV